jgi:TRAP-type C4-dicarboxylate transport system substrate-binding protein
MATRELNMPNIIITFTAGVAVATFAASSHAETWDMPMAYSASNFQSETGAQFAECVTQGTGGALTIQTHPGGSLYAGAEIKRAIQTGQVNIGERLLSGNQNENALFGFDSIPFLATSFEESEKLWEAAKGPLSELLAEQNLHLLYSVPWPGQGLYFDREVNSLADAKGLKFRAYNTASGRLSELAGMLPVQIESAEIAQAFATGVAQGMVSSGAAGYDRKVWESLSHYYSVNAWLPRNYVLVNADAWEGLNESTKNVINGCATLAEYSGDWRSIQYAEFTEGELAKNGMTTGPASEELMNELRAIGETMTAEWIEAAGEEGRSIVDAFRAAQ